MTNFTRASSAFVSGTTITASATNDNWSGLETFLNTTGVHVYQAGTIETAALEDDAVTGAKIANNTILPGSMASPEWVQVELTADIALTEDTETVITAAAYGASLSATGNYGTNVGWDSTNKRPYAVTAGTFLISIRACIGIVHSAASDVNRYLTLKKNTSNVVQTAEFDYIGGGSGKQKSVLLSRIVTANANDYFRFSVQAGQATGAYTSAELTTGSASETYMEVLYLGA